MDGVEVITKLQRLAKNQLENLTLSITSGNVDNMEKYQYMIGQIRVYEYLLQELSNLLSKKEHKDNGGNIIKLD
jgi:hypothetical protein